MPMNVEDTYWRLVLALECYDRAATEVDRAAVRGVLIGSLPAVLLGLWGGFGTGLLVLGIGLVGLGGTVGYERGVARSLPLQLAGCLLVTAATPEG